MNSIIKQAIKENWVRTINFWCQTLEIGKKEARNLRDYHVEYLDIKSRKRIGIPVHNGINSQWLLTYKEFQILREYRASQPSRGRPKGAKDSIPRKIENYLGRKLGAKDKKKRIIT